MDARRKTLAWKCPGGTGGSLHLNLSQGLIELLGRVRPDKPTVKIIKNLSVLQSSPNNNPAQQ